LFLFKQKGKKKTNEGQKKNESASHAMVHLITETQSIYS